MNKGIFCKDDLDFITICGNALHSKEYQQSEVEINWKGIFEKALKAKVLPLVFDESHKMGVSLFDSNYSEYSKIAITSIAIQIKRNAIFKETYEKILENGIVAIVTKGIICRSLLKEKSCMRPSKDEDIMINVDDFERVNHLLNNMGFTLVEEIHDINKQDLAKMHEIHYVHSSSNTEIEVHFNTMGHKTSAFSKIDELFVNVFDSAQLIDIEYEKDKFMQVYSMDFTNHLLFIFFHAYRHFFTGGFGIRQVMDLLLFFENNINKIDLEYVESVLEKTGTKLLFNDMLHIGNKYMSFSLPTFETSETYDELLEILLNIVNNRDSQAYKTARSMIFSLITDRFSGKMVSNNGKKSVFLWINTIFPPYKEMRSRFPEIDNKPWLLPLAWAKRMILFSKHSAEFEGDLSKEAIEIVQMRIKLLQKYKII